VVAVTDHHLTDLEIIDAVADPIAHRTADREAIVAEAVSVIDGALAQMMQRELVSSGEVADLLLDVRTLLTAQQ
jgi:hypothetical protein